MKKKISILALILFLFTSTVYAASINGDYEGDPVVKVTLGGKELVATDVPAILHNNRTLVPLYLLKQAGIKLEWDLEKFSVDVKLPDATTATPQVDITAIIKDLSTQGKALNASNIKMVNDEQGPYLVVDLSSSENTTTDMASVSKLSTFSLDLPVDEIIVRIIYRGIPSASFTISKQNVVDLNNNKITGSDFMKSWKFTDLTKTN